MSKIRKVILVAAVLWVLFLIEDALQSSASPTEAIESERSSPQEWMQVKQYIVSSKLNDQAIYFYLNPENRIVCVQLAKGWFGWKARSFSTGSGMALQEELQTVNGYNRSDYLVFGLAGEKVHRLEVNSTAAVLIPLDMYIQQEEARGKQLWYAGMEPRVQQIELRAYDKDNHILKP